MNIKEARKKLAETIREITRLKNLEISLSECEIGKGTEEGIFESKYHTGRAAAYQNCEQLFCNLWRETKGEKP